MNTAKGVLVASEVTKTYGRPHRRGGRGPTIALDGVTMRVGQGTSVGIAGESGSGKSTLVRLLLGLEASTEGEVRFDGQDVVKMSRSQCRAYRAAVQVVFQDPASSFDPRQRIWKAVTEPAWALRGVTDRQERTALAARMLRQVGLDESYLGRLPHQLSGGEAQRASIARALSCGPSIVLLDEPVTALDTIIRKQVIELLRTTAAEQGITYVAVSHDLHALHHLVDRLYVMRAGVVVEEGAIVDVLEHPKHAYTRMLVDCINDPLYVGDDEPLARRSGFGSY